jgi:S-adenosylmethionine hydrolase
MKGVIAKIAPGALIADITHGIPAQEVTAGAVALAQSWRYFPARTIFTVVVDPGVGTARRAIAISTEGGAIFVGPDNGILWPAAHAAGIRRIVELNNPRYRLSRISSTFHGRDVFAPAAAWLARGVKFESMGPLTEEIVKLDLAAGVREDSLGLHGSVIYVDHFGNLITNLQRELVEQFADGAPQARLSAATKGRTAIGIFNTYGEVSAGDVLALFGSFEMLEIAVREGNAAEKLGIAAGEAVTISRKV